jgi:hypothetical protein
MVVINCTDPDELVIMNERIKARRAAAKKDKADKKAGVAAVADVVLPLLTPIDGTDMPPPIVQPVKHGKRNSHVLKQEKIDEAKKAKPEIQQDPATSTTFKSLFTTSEGARNQPKAAWVTHHSYYY